jgi:hypothetical protein
MAVGRLAPVDRWTVAYAAFASLAILDRWPQHLPVPPVLLVGHAALALMALCAALRRKRPAARFVGEFYALACAPLLYTAIGVRNTAAGVALDATGQVWEQAIFFDQPSREWIRQQPWPALSAVLHAGYLSYYLLCGGSRAPRAVDLRPPRRRPPNDRAVGGSLLPLLCRVPRVPGGGPRYLFPPAENVATAVAPARLARALLEAGSAWGTAFPLRGRRRGRHRRGGRRGRRLEM